MATRGSRRSPSAGPAAVAARRRGPPCIRSSPSASATISSANPERYRTNSIAAGYAAYTVVRTGPGSGLFQIDEFDPVRHRAHRVLLLRVQGAIRLDRIDRQVVRIEPGRQQEPAARIDRETARRRLARKAADRAQRAVLGIDLEPG